MTLNNMEGSSEASTSFPSEQPKPSLGTLPPELKAIIVAMVHEVDCEAVMAAQEDDDDEDYDSVEEIDDEDEKEEKGKQSSKIKTADKGKWVEARLEDVLSEDTLGNDEVVDDEGDDDEGSFGSEEEFSSVHKTMRKLALVNREFAALAQSFIWTAVDMRDKSLPDVYYFYTTIIPRQAQHIVGLNFSANEPISSWPSSEEIDWEDIDDDDDDDDEPDADNVASSADAEDAQKKNKPVPAKKKEKKSDMEDDYVKVLDALAAAGTLSQNTRASTRQQCATARVVLFDEILRKLPKLTTLDFDLADHYPRNDGPLDPLRVPVVDSFPGSLMEEGGIGAQIIDLTLYSDSDSMVPFGELEVMLGAFPNLERLQLDVEPTSEDEDDGPECVYRALTGLEHLKNLTLENAYWFDSRFNNYDFKGPLKILALEQVVEVPWHALRRSVEKLSSTLEVLELRDFALDFENLLTSATYHEATGEGDQHETRAQLLQPWKLPKLDTLVLETGHDPVILTVFDECPIKQFELKECDLVDDSDIEDFIKTHESTLKRLIIPRDWLTAGQEESLELLSFHKGINVVLRSADYDSEDDDDDYNDYDEDDDPDGDEDTFGDVYRYGGLNPWGYGDAPSDVDSEDEYDSEEEFGPGGSSRFALVD